MQKAWVIDQLPVLLEINRQAVIEKILPKISVSLIIIAISSVLQLNGLLVTMSLQDKEELQLNSQKTSRNAMNSLKTSRKCIIIEIGQLLVSFAMGKRAKTSYLQCTLLSLMVAMQQQTCTS